MSKDNTPESPTENKAEDTPLSLFSHRNPEARIEVRDGNLIVEKPWGDDSLVISVNATDKPLIDDLNFLRLPPRFTAIWHQDTNDLEVIFGPLRSDHPLRFRRFDFHFDGELYPCEFDDASKRLVNLANATIADGPPSDTDHRHMLLIRSFLRFLEREQEGTSEKDTDNTEQKPPYILTSFWIRAVKIEEEELVNLARHLNFYMEYFDPTSPRILIHPEPTAIAGVSQPRLPEFDSFPESITGRSLDPYLLGLWESAISAADTVRRFLYSYQILEYAAFYFLRDDLMTSVRRILGAPDVCTHIEQTSRRLLDLLAEQKMSDEQKITEVVRRSVELQKIWTVVDSWSEFFCSDQTFEGGFTVSALIRQGWTLEDFQASWSPKLPDLLRQIRNALVHAREQRLTRSISPTASNRHLLRPYADLALAVANEVVLYERA